MSKKVLAIDVIVDDRSFSQKAHLEEILAASEDGAAGQGLELKVIHLPSENIDLGELKDAAGVIFSGSMKSAYEEFDWKKKMHQLMENVLSLNKETLAICFGAQFLAYHLGSEVIKNPRGTEFGPIKVNLTEAGRAEGLLKGFDNDAHLFATHNDIIESLPEGATLLAYNENTPIQAYAYGRVFASQFHVDVPTRVAQILLGRRKEKYLESGFLKDEQAYFDLMDALPLGAESHLILSRFLAKI